MATFEGFPKIARFSRDVIITEKIDGTNAQIYIGEDGEFLTGSRNRWITPDSDNAGFSRWAHEHKDELMQLGPGRHFGEWWGSGIQRGYGLKNGDKRFSLFNVGRWCLHDQAPLTTPTEDPRITRVQDVLPPCVGLVPILWRGSMDSIGIGVTYSLWILESEGSAAAPGYTNPEGIVIFHEASRTCFKKTIKDDSTRKGLLVNK